MVLRPLAQRLWIGCVVPSKVLRICTLASPSFLAYTHLGCWKDTGNRAVPQMDGSDARIRGNYRARADAINKCYQVARERHMVIFAVQHQGWCAAAKTFVGYQKYGKSTACKNGKGGPWANDVYRITNPIKPATPKPKREYFPSRSHRLAPFLPLSSFQSRPGFDLE